MPLAHILTSIFVLSGLENQAQISASSYYNIPPYQDAFVPSLVADGDASTAWSSNGEGCRAALYFTFSDSKTVDAICARSRDMVDDPAVPHTDDSVIESFKVLLDDVPVQTCILPDWRQEYCCTIVTPIPAKNITLAASSCRDRADGPGNTGFKTVVLHEARHQGGSADHSTIIGHENEIRGKSSGALLIGEDLHSDSSDDVLVQGHSTRILSSDNATITGVASSALHSDRAVVIGYNVNASNADNAVVVGSDLHTVVPTQVVLGSHNAPSIAKFVVAGGSATEPRNLLEIMPDGQLVNAHIDALEQKIVELEERLNEALSGCTGHPSCKDIKFSFRNAGCCPS
jgi:hypothetical protein